MVVAVFASAEQADASTDAEACAAAAAADSCSEAMVFESAASLAKLYLPLFKATALQHETPLLVAGGGDGQLLGSSYTYPCDSSKS